LEKKKKKKKKIGRKEKEKEKEKGMRTIGLTTPGSVRFRVVKVKKFSPSSKESREVQVASPRGF